MGSAILMNFRDLFWKIAIHTVKALKINKMIYKCSSSKKVSYDESSLKEARLFLETYSPNPKTSCRCQNEIEHKADIHIIIPAYNVEQYIEDCLNSIFLKPTEKYSFIVTVVNDGSTDKTPDILKKYEKDPRLEIITQENRGFSGARNTALKHIKGRYLLFVDSDDLMDWQGVEKMMDTALETHADVICGSYTTIHEDGRKKHFYKRKNGNLKISTQGGVPWSKLFASHLFSDVCFPENYWYEDSIFAQIVFPRVSSAYGIDANTYFYRNRASSITHQGVKKVKSIDSFWITERLFEERMEYGLKITTQYYEYILKMLRLTFSRIKLQPYKVKKNVFILFCDLVDKNFSGCKTDDDNCKELEKIIKNRDVGKCIAYAKWM